MPHDHGHTHIDPESGDRRVSIAIWANGLLTVAQIVGGILSGSLALIADALHNFSDMASLVIAFVARKIARRPADERMTFGYGRIAARRGWAAILQVCDDGHADILRKRHACSLSALRMNEDLPRLPVDIIEREGCDLARPQSKPGQHHEDGVVPSPQSRGSITTVEDLLNLSGGQIGRQIGKPPSSDGRYAGGKIGVLQAAVIEISEKCAQRPAHLLCGCRASVPGVALNVQDDVFPADVAKIAGVGGTNLAQKAANDRLMGDDRPRRQPALLSQIVAEPRKYPILRSDRRLWCRCDHIRFAQHRQKPLQRRPVTRLEALLLPGSGQNMGVMRRVFCLRRSADHRELRPL